MSDPDSEYAERTLTMTVRNTGFMVDRLGQDCAPLQFLRELTQNSIEAIKATPEGTGDIIWDVDWDMYDLRGVYKLCVIDNGCGMTGEDMVQYINQLSSSVHEQSHDGNYGVGAKIAAATRNHNGLIYLSWKDGVGSMIHLWRDPDQSAYGLRQVRRPNGTYGHWAHIEDTVKPREDLELRHHGTKVVLLGNDNDENTMRAPAGAASPSRWIGRYLNTRYFQFPEGITVRAREGWENARADKDRNVLRRVTGQRRYLEAHAEAQGTVPLAGAVAHWWILRDEPALSQNSGFVASNGHTAALYKDELYEMLTGRAGTARLQQFGVIFGYQQVVIYVAPDTGLQSVQSNTARTHLLLDREPLPWSDWAAEFRSAMPVEISQLMEEITAGADASDHKQAIRERLKQIRELFRFSRYRPTPAGDKLISEPDSAGGSSRQRGRDETTGKSSSSGGRGGGRAGTIYALFLSDDGQPGETVFTDNEPEVQWITVEEGTRIHGFLEDRAAKFLPEQNLLQINGDFRAFTDMVERWSVFYSHVPGARREIRDACREWFEQALIETVLGVQALKDSREWTVEDISKTLSEEALTAAVMPRYHIDVAVKRALGAKLGTLKDRVAS